jgi:endosialidase-like protein
MLRKREVIGWLILVLTIVWPLALWGADPEIQQPKTPIARLEVQPARVDWLPQVDYEYLSLTVAGPGDLFIRQEFVANQAPFLSLFDAKGNRLPDGSYTYELRVVPRQDHDARQSLETARETPERLDSGYLLIRNGEFVNTDLPGRTVASKPQAAARAPLSPVTAKQVTPENVCIGDGCGSGDDDFPVLKLKSTVPWLKFEDDFNALQPADRDWTIRVNDPFQGSAEFFAIGDEDASTVPFTIEGGAPDHSLYVRSNGNLGLGTSTPGAKLHLYGSATADAIGSAGPDPVSGPAFNFGYAGTSIGRGVGFLNVRPDASATAPNPSLRLFTVNVERMIITNTGNVGIGTSSPEAKLHVFGSSTADTIIGLGPNPDGSPGTESAFNVFYGGATAGRGAGMLNVRPDSGATAPNPSLRFWVANTERMIIDNEGFIGLGVANPTSPIHHSSGAILTSGGTWQNASSRELKRDIAKLAADEARTTLQGLEPVKFAYKVDPKERHVGFIAEDVPDLVAAPDRKSLSPMDLVAVLTRVVQEQQKAIDTLSATVGELRTKLDEIEKGRPETITAESPVRMP